MAKHQSQPPPGPNSNSALARRVRELEERVEDFGREQIAVIDMISEILDYIAEKEVGLPESMQAKRQALVNPNGKKGGKTK